MPKVLACHRLIKTGPPEASPEVSHSVGRRYQYVVDEDDVCPSTGPKMFHGLSRSRFYRHDKDSYSSHLSSQYERRFRKFPSSPDDDDSSPSRYGYYEVPHKIIRTSRSPERRYARMGSSVAAFEERFVFKRKRFPNMHYNNALSPTEQSEMIFMEMPTKVQQEQSVQAEASHTSSFKLNGESNKEFQVKQSAMESEDSGDGANEPDHDERRPSNVDYGGKNDMDVFAESTRVLNSVGYTELSAQLAEIASKVKEHARRLKKHAQDLSVIREEMREMRAAIAKQCTAEEQMFMGTEYIPERAYGYVFPLPAVAGIPARDNLFTYVEELKADGVFTEKKSYLKFISKVSRYILERIIPPELRRVFTIRKRQGDPSNISLPEVVIETILDIHLVCCGVDAAAKEQQLLVNTISSTSLKALKCILEEMRRTRWNSRYTTSMTGARNMEEYGSEALRKRQPKRALDEEKGSDDSGNADP